MISAKKLLYKIVEKIGEIDSHQALINYPIGSYYETSKSQDEFDPNIAWGGTWVLETAGLVHIGAGTGYTLGATGGEATVTLTTNQIPSHKHGFYDYQSWMGIGRTEPDMNHLTAPKMDTEHLVYTENAGGGQAHNNMPPYVVVNRWHRTA